MNKKTIHFFQPQFPMLIDGIYSIWLPYSVACLWAYAQSFTDINDNWQLGKLHCRRTPLDKVLDELGHPAVCAFSTYIWNEKYCLELARRIKQRWPDCYIIFGGPQTGGNHIQHEFIDTMVMAEGEEAFVDILRCLQAGKKPEQFYNKKRIDNLDYPSPYELGLFDPIVAEHPKDFTFDTTIETNRGCPYACTYCDWGGLTYSKVRKFDLSRIEKDLKWIKNNRVRGMFITDANFGIFKERDMEIAKLIIRELEGSTVDLVNVTWLKNSNETAFQIAKELGRLSRSMTLSVQSMNPDTLKAIKRDNMKVNDLENMLALSKKYDVGTYTDMILGLPLETLESWCNGLCELLELGQHNQCEVYVCSLLENTELNQIQRKQYNIKTVSVENLTTFSLNNFDDDTTIKDCSDIVSSTSTMTTEDMVEGFMFHWMLQNFHYSGYSQIVSKYCRNVLGISYRKFYDNLYEHVKTHDSVIGELYQGQRRGIYEILTHGKVLEKEISVYTFLYYHLYNFYQNMDLVFNIVFEATRRLGVELDPSIIDAQTRFVGGSGPNNEEFVSSYDLDTWQPGPVKYRVSSAWNVNKGELTRSDFLKARKRTLMKNKFVVVDENLVECLT